MSILTNRFGRARLLPLALAPLLLAAVAASCAAAGKHGAPSPAVTPAGPRPRLEISPPQVAASAELTWVFELKLVNPMAVGCYSDSVSCELKDTGPGETRSPRAQTLSFPAVAQGIGTVSGGDSSLITQSMPASFETGTVSFRLYGHQGDGLLFSAASPALEVRPGPLSDEHPSEFLEAGGGKVEVVLFPSRHEGPSPGLLLVHDHGSNARLLMSLALQFSMRGYTVLLASMPGYGLSQGPADFCGARTVAAIGAALDRLKGAPDVDPKRLAAWGIGRGANAVASLAAGRADLAAVITQSGIYDLWAATRGASATDTRAAIVAEAGADSSAWRERSPLLKAGGIRAAALVLHGEADLEAPAAQARAFAAAIEKSGAPVESKFLPGAGHILSRGDSQRAVIAFLKGRFAP